MISLMFEHFRNDKGYTLLISKSNYKDFYNSLSCDEHLDFALSICSDSPKFEIITG